MTVAVLFARSDSIYKQLPDVEVYDMERDARTYDGPWPVVAHPPCRAWGAFAMFAKPRPDERNLARLSVALVREFGGVLEHPFRSALWPAQRLPEQMQRDAFGGWTLVIDQHWWGHRAQKRTKLYIVGCEPGQIPDMPIKLGQAECVVGDVGRASTGDDRPEVSKAEREHTPPCWLSGLSIWPGGAAPLTPALRAKERDVTTYRIVPAEPSAEQIERGRDELWFMFATDEETAAFVRAFYLAMTEQCPEVSGEPVAWALRIKKPRSPSLLYRGVYTAKPTAEQMEFAEMDGDEYVPLYTTRMNPETFSLAGVGFCLLLIGAAIQGDAGDEPSRSKERRFGRVLFCGGLLCCAPLFVRLWIGAIFGA